MGGAIRGVDPDRRVSLECGDNGDIGNCPEERELRIAPFAVVMPRSLERFWAKGFCARDVVE
jgi:hypothetical protein